jgi:hypothetical protein
VKGAEWQKQMDQMRKQMDEMMARFENGACQIVVR